MQFENWNDLRFLLALHRKGTIIGAATELDVDQTTVTRRLRALEKTAGSELYEKRRGGAVLTKLGLEMVMTAELLETTCTASRERIPTSPQVRPDRTPAPKMAASRGNPIHFVPASRG